MIDLIIEIQSFDQKCFIIGGLVQSERLKQHMVKSQVDLLLSDSELYEHISMENINKLYKSSEGCDNQQEYKAIIESAKISICEVFNDKIPISPS